ncbi:MAG: hypothetical protein EX254_10485 [Flavobacteriaceae bacterium]|nr:MAG: hypothetical protein EX254_10485 [Flavobacteriaceae bacterium]
MYTLTEAYEIYIDRIDKQGSDFVQLPEFLRHFKSATYDFIGERIPVIEKTQQIVEDLRTLMTPFKATCIQDPNDSYAVIASIPSNCHHLARVNALYSDGTSGRRPTFIRQGNIDPYNASPSKKPAKEYPVITQYMDYVKIQSGYNDKAEFAFLTYIAKPTFAGLTQSGNPIVNLNVQAVEDIINKAVVRTMAAKGDPRMQSEVYQEQSYREGQK